MNTYDLNIRPEDLPDAMARATRIGRIDALECRPRIRSTKTLADRVSPGCALGYAVSLKQAYNAGYWSVGTVPLTGANYSLKPVTKDYPSHGDPGSLECGEPM